MPLGHANGAVSVAWNERARQLTCRWWCCLSVDCQFNPRLVHDDFQSIKIRSTNVIYLAGLHSLGIHSICLQLAFHLTIGIHAQLLVCYKHKKLLCRPKFLFPSFMFYSLMSVSVIWVWHDNIIWHSTMFTNTFRNQILAQLFNVYLYKNPYLAKSSNMLI